MFHVMFTGVPTVIVLPLEGAVMVVVGGVKFTCDEDGLHVPDVPPHIACT